jgi:hypothetical protein
MLAYIFVLVAVAVRFSPHPWAFTPVGASLLFFGARAPRRRMWIPLALFAASDVVLTTFVYHFPMSWEYLVTWAWYAGMLWLGSSIKENAGAVRILVTALCGSVSFFLISNFTVWAGGNMYPKTFAGLVTCYGAGLPFFRHGVEGDLLYTSVFFGIPVLIQYLAGRLQKTGGGTAAA